MANVSDLNAAQNVNFTLGENIPVEASIDGNYATNNFDAGELSNGEYTLTATSFNTSSETISEISATIMMDGSGPEITFPGEEYVGDDPEITVEFSDEHTGVESFEDLEGDTFDNVEVTSVDGFGSCSPGNTCTVDYSIDTGELSGGDTFQLNVEATDQVGNPSSGSADFTFDDAYDGDSPEFSVEDADEDNNIRLDDVDDVKDVTVTLDEGDEVSDIRVTCYVGGDQVDQTDFESVDEDGFEFDCSLDGEDYAGNSEDIYVEACDEAGYCEESDSRRYSFDYQNPVVDSFETVQSYSVFNEDFDVSYDVDDEASGLEVMEYSLSPTTLPGNGESVSFDDYEGSFTVGTSDLSRDNYTLYFRVKDGVERWSDVATADFEFYPNEAPELSVSAVQSLNVTAESSETLQVDVENTGELFIPSSSISVSGASFAQDSQDVSDLAPGDTVTVRLQLEPNSSHIGRHNLSVSSDEPQASQEVDILVEANSEKEEEIRSRVDNFSLRMEDLESNISDLRSSGLSEEINSSLSGNVSDFVTAVRNAESYADRELYYKAMNELEGISEKYEVAQQAYFDAEEQHRLNERNNVIKAFLGVVLLVSIGGVLFVSRSDEHDLGVPEESIPDLGVIGQGVGLDVSGRIESLKEFIEKEEEEVEEGFEGFEGFR